VAGAEAGALQPYAPAAYNALKPCTSVGSPNHPGAELTHDAPTAFTALQTSVKM
jgi:hypothetical protein